MIIITVSIEIIHINWSFFIVPILNELQFLFVLGRPTENFTLKKFVR